MKVTIMSATDKPIDNISLAAGGCYGKTNVSSKRIQSCVKSGHTSIIEHAYLTFKIEGVSRSLLAQLTRHRLMSFCVESQRYCKYDLIGDDWSLSDDWYVVPEAIQNASQEVQDAFKASMWASGNAYMTLLHTFHVKPEDARYVLPEAMKTNLTCSMNAREFYNFLCLRLSPRASAEIHELAELMFHAAKDINEQWEELMNIFSDNMSVVM